MRATPVIAGVVFLLLSYSNPVLSQAPVESLSVPASEVQQQNEQQQAATVELYLDIQTLRAELSELRGTIEELNYEIQRLQSRQSTDYANLDERLQLLRSGIPADSLVSGSDSETTITEQTGELVAPQIDSEKAADLYSEGLAKLRNGDRQGALSTFSDLITNYPTDAVVADAYYWVGETHWVAGENEQAREAYAGLVNNFPDNRKYGDALYKLARVYLNLEDSDQAVILLQEAQQLGGDVGARASELLEEISQTNI